MKHRSTNVDRDRRATRGAVVTGGASGIGLAVVRRLASEGASVLVADVNRPPGVEASEDADAGEPGSIEWIRTDVTDAGAVEALSARSSARAVPCDTLVLCAGVGVHERLSEGDPAKWSRAIETNLTGSLRVARAILPGMPTSGGDVVIVSSVAASRPYAWGGAYSASKAGLEAAAEALREEALPRVRVTTIAPGVVDTPFFSRSMGGVDRAEEIGWGALEAEDVARVVSWALSRPRRVAVNRVTLRPVRQVL